MYIYIFNIRAEEPVLTYSVKFPIHNISTSVLIENIIINIIVPFGIPTTLITTGHIPFRSAAFLAFCNEIGTAHRLNYEHDKM